VRETLAPADLPNVDWRDEIYGADPDAVLDMVEGMADSVERLLVVGHNPTMFLLANRLGGDGPEEARRALSEKYPTGALALIDFDVDRWRDLAAGKGRLARFVRPRDL
jgi:phosphohistidine phosphatase